MLRLRIGLKAHMCGQGISAKTFGFGHADAAMHCSRHLVPLALLTLVCNV